MKDANLSTYVEVHVHYSRISDIACIHKLIACHILNVIPDVSLESLMCSTLLPYNDDGIFGVIYCIYYCY